MIVSAWVLVGLWAIALLASARSRLAPLPAGAGARVPPYQLWLPEGGAPPPLEPPPQALHTGAEPPTEGPERVLVLGDQVTVPEDLPARLTACAVPFVSVFPRPHGGALGLTVERIRRDFARPELVADPGHPAAYADPRCAWLSRADLMLPGDGDEPVLRAARARKAHACAVELREGGALVGAPAISRSSHLATLDDLTGGDRLVRALLFAFPLALCAGPFLLLPVSATRDAALLALLLGTAARLMTALRDGFGGRLCLIGWPVEISLAIAALTAPRRSRPPAPFPEAPDASSAPALTAPVGDGKRRGGRWLSGAAVPFLASRLGGAAPVMEQIYANRPAGRSVLGRVIDRAVLGSQAARAVRHRRLATVRLVRPLRPITLLSAPCGGAGDAREIGAPQTTLVDPDPSARALAQAACPGAHVIDATIETAPPGPFDVVLYVGLSEYLDDDQVVTQLRTLTRRLERGGALLTTCTASHPQRQAMARWLGWQTRARDPQRMVNLLGRAGLSVEARATDPWRIQWTFLCRPT